MTPPADPVLAPVVSVVGKYMVTVKLLNIRKGPSTDFDYAGTPLPLHTVVDVASFEGNWAKLTSGSYCYTSYMAPLVPGPIATITTPYVVTSAFLNIRQGPGADQPIAGNPMPKNTPVNVVETQGDWAKLTSGVWCYLPYMTRAPWPTSQ